MRGEGREREERTKQRRKKREKEVRRRGGREGGKGEGREGRVNKGGEGEKERRRKKMVGTRVQVANKTPGQLTATTFCWRGSMTLIFLSLQVVAR